MAQEVISARERKSNPLNALKKSGAKMYYGNGAKVYYYKRITSRLTEVYDSNGKYMGDVRNLEELKETL